MDKREFVKRIAKELLTMPKEEKNDIEYITSDQLDKIIFKVCERLDRNLKYEMRAYLKTFGMIRYVQIANHDICFIIIEKEIKKFCGDKNA